MRKLNITIELEDNDLVQFNLEKQLNKVIGDKIIAFKVLPDTEHLKDNATFKTLYKAKKDAEIKLYRYINDNR